MTTSKPSAAVIQEPKQLVKYLKIDKPDTKIETIKSILLLCWNINKLKNFENITFKEVKGITLLKRIRSNIFYLDYIDHDSQFYTSLYGMAKKTLEEELKTKKYEYWYSYILNFFSATDLKSIVAKKSNKVEFFPDKKSKTFKDADKEKELGVWSENKETKFIAVNKEEVLVNPKYTGKQLVKDREKFADFKDNLNLE